MASRYPPPPRAPVGHPRAESGRALQRQQRVSMRGQRGLLGRSSARRAIPKRASACARAHGRTIRPVQPRSRPGHARGGCLPPRSASSQCVAQPAPIRRSTRDPRGGRVARAQCLVRVCERGGVRGNWATLTRPTGCAHIVVWAAPRTTGQHRGRFARRSSRTQRRPHRDPPAPIWCAPEPPRRLPSQSRSRARAPPPGTKYSPKNGFIKVHSDNSLKVASGAARP